MTAMTLLSLLLSKKGGLQVLLGLLLLVDGAV
jgi:hypothetical protein